MAIIEALTGGPVAGSLVASTLLTDGIGVAIAWAAGLAIAPGFVAATPFLLGSLRRRSERWWLMSPARARRRMDPRCSRRAWARLAAYSAGLFVPGLLGGLLLGWTVVGLVVAAASALSVLISLAVLVDSPRLSRAAWLPAVYSASLFAAAAYGFAAWFVTHGYSGVAAMWAAYLAPWLIAQAVAGWQILVAYRAQDGARAIARAALSDAVELWLT